MPPGAYHGIAFGNQAQAQPEKPLKDQRLEELDDVITHHRALLVRIFTYYCSFGEPLNTNKMRSSKFIKFLKDAGLLQNASNTFKVSAASGQRPNQASLRNQNFDRATGEYNPTGGKRGDAQGHRTPIPSGRSPSNRNQLQRMNSQGARTKTDGTPAGHNLAYGEQARGPAITKVQADLLFKRYTGHQK